MTDGTKIALLGGVLIAALVLYMQWKKRQPGAPNAPNGASCNANPVGQPAYMMTAATNEQSVAGNPEPEPCPGAPHMMTSKPSGYRCR
jgi:hypothetical protein